MIANGLWERAAAARSACVCLVSSWRSPVTNRRLPSLSRASASWAEIIGRY